MSKGTILTAVDDFYFELLVRGDYQSGLEILRHAFDAHAGGIMSITQHSIQMLTAQGVNPESVEVYNSHLNTEDYMFPYVNRKPGDDLVWANRLVSLQDVEGSDYYQFVDKPSDVHDKISFYIVAPQKRFSLSLYRDKKRMFSDSDYELAQQIQPHLARCFRLLEKKSMALEQRFADHELTRREVEIATMISMGNNYSRICTALQISSNTLKWHMKNIFDKFGVRSLSELAITLRLTHSSPSVLSSPA